MSATPSRSTGVLPRHVDLAHRCREQVVEGFMSLYREFQQELPDILLRMAEQAESDAFQTHCMDVHHEIRQHAEDMSQNFYNELMAGFERFILGHPAISEDGDTGQAQPTRKRLSLVEKETFEIELAYDTVANSACVNYSELIHTLNHRLAVINGGVKPGERSASLPGSPHHVCNAFRAALSAIKIPIDTAVKVSLIESFDKQILRRAKNIYQEYNQLLIQAGILPNLEDTPLYIPPAAETREEAQPDAEEEDETGEEENEEEAETGALQAPFSNRSAAAHAPSQQSSQSTFASPQSAPETREELLEQQIFQTISQLLRQQRQSAPATPPSATGPANVSELMHFLGQGDSPQPASVPRDVATLPLDQIRAEFSRQVAQLAELIKQHQIQHTDADVIELVGMLFEQILNDHQLPDSVKALLSYLHTPYLKLALMDRRFFFKRRHPARRLLNILTQAGAMCNATAKNEQVVFSRMRDVVNRILIDFDENIELFEELLQDFETFLEQYRQRARMQEKRAIEKAKGQERLREARQAVARELIEIIRDHPLPKAAEKLIFGPWSNLLVLLYLRTGADSEVRQHYLTVTRDLVWSVQPKSTPAEKRELRHRLPEINKAIREGLALLGDPDPNADQLLAELDAHHQKALACESESEKSPEPTDPSELTQYPLLREIDLEELPGHREVTPNGLDETIKQLQKMKLGTWFELNDHKTGQPIRAKLSWFSPKTSYYIFVNQAGIQVAVRPLRKLAKELLSGEARIIEMDKKPFVERALHRIHRLLGGSRQS